jgi:flagellar biosynthesis/type III secretory pathway protein FliH
MAFLHTFEIRARTCVAAILRHEPLTSGARSSSGVLRGAFTPARGTGRMATLGKPSTHHLCCSLNTTRPTPPLSFLLPIFLMISRKNVDDLSLTLFFSLRYGVKRWGKWGARYGTRWNYGKSRYWQRGFRKGFRRGWDSKYSRGYRDGLKRGLKSSRKSTFSKQWRRVSTKLVKTRSGTRRYGSSYKYGTSYSYQVSYKRGFNSAYKKAYRKAFKIGERRGMRAARGRKSFSSGWRKASSRFFKRSSRYRSLGTSWRRGTSASYQSGYRKAFARAKAKYFKIGYKYGRRAKSSDTLASLYKRYRVAKSIGTTILRRGGRGGGRRRGGFGGRCDFLIPCAPSPRMSLASSISLPRSQASDPTHLSIETLFSL